MSSGRVLKHVYAGTYADEVKQDRFFHQAVSYKMIQSTCEWDCQVEFLKRIQIIAVIYPLHLIFHFIHEKFFRYCFNSFKSVSEITISRILDLVFGEYT